MSRRVTLALTLVVTAGSLLFVAVATAAEEPVTYVGCLDTKKGDLTSVGIGEALDVCKDAELVVSWNSVGPPGPQGESGLDGVDGVDGVQGLQGEPGVDGVDGEPCSVEEVSEGTFTMTCPDSSVTWTIDPPSPPPPPPPPDEELIFAVAYIDMNDDLGPYDPAEDVLIAKLFDGPDYDRKPGPGDLIITNQYPTDFVPTLIGSFRSTEHTVWSTANQIGFGEDTCEVWAGEPGATADYFVWLEGSSAELFGEVSNALGYESVTSFWDDINDITGGDRIQITESSPSLPTDTTIRDSEDPADFLGDSVFVDIDMACFDHSGS